MAFLNQIVDHILGWLFFVLVAFVLTDSLVLYLVQRHKPLLSNTYYKFHKKYGFFIISAGKLICTSLIAYDLLNPSGNTGKLAGPIMVYGFLVAKLLYDFIIKKG